MAEEFFKGKKVLITGASGFIGSHMVQRMAKENANVCALARESSDLWRIEDVIEEIDVRNIDLRDQEALVTYVNQIKPDFIFHFGAYGVDARQKDYHVAVNSNITGTMNLINAVAETGCEKFINTGSCAEYGNKTAIIQERDELCPLSIYGSTKAASVIIAHQIAHEKDIDIITLRSFGVFGENEGSHKFFPNLILSILRNIDINLTLCEQYRDYCYIENIIDGFVLAAKNKTVKNGIFNIGSGVVHKMKVLVDIVFKNLNAQSKPNYGAVPYRENEMWKQQPDIKKIQNVLGWEPQIGLEEGIIRTIDWYKNNLHKYENTGR
ncbi:MAG TPA: SDR family NAD(P)-dependent oxidoreductase [Pseudobacteroides sp.]|uniref:NAD-dependent epimerase/dehydratase family protein n=1 Tax=Pseudobacteroides sp. TaxID=1968840 RepID=UPI002F934D0B